MAKKSSSDQARRFGPLTSLVVAAVLAFLVLPSTLTLPNPSPTSQEEIAPVPPTQSKTNPPVSNFTSLSSGTTGNGLGSTGSGGGTKAGELPPPPSLPPGVGNLPPSTYQCVAGRQTEDPLSPTCVPFFQGENGGATYQGVTPSEVRIILYYEPYGSLNTSQGTSTPPYNSIIDTDLPPKPNEHPSISTARGWSKYFLSRYATYNRKVKLFVQFGSYDSQAQTSAGTQTQDAALAYSKVKPFAVINYAQFGNGTFYNNYMAEKGVLNFGSIAVRSDKFYRAAPGQQWGYGPTIEYRASSYANFVCNSIAGKTTKDVGAQSTGIRNGTPRKYGFLFTTDPAFEEITEQGKLSMAAAKKQCGITPAIQQSYAKNSFSVDNGTTPRSATNVALAFQQAGVTTVLWPAGYEVKISQAFKNLNYYPEIILGDDDQQASTQGAGFQDPAAFDHAWIVTNQTYDPPPNDSICVQSYRTVDQQSPQADVTQFACETYNDLRQLYTGIQVAGPKLTPQSVDQGFHAIPVVESQNPQVPTCFYLANDYTCVKDTQIMHWDSTGKTQSNSRTQGCWRMVGNGKRYLPGKYPKTDLDAMKKPSHRCNEYSKSANLSLAPGTA